MAATLLQQHLVVPCLGIRSESAQEEAAQHIQCTWWGHARVAWSHLDSHKANHGQRQLFPRTLLFWSHFRLGSGRGCPTGLCHLLQPWNGLTWTATRPTMASAGCLQPSSLANSASRSSRCGFSAAAQARMARRKTGLLSSSGAPILLHWLPLPALTHALQSALSDTFASEMVNLAKTSIESERAALGLLTAMANKSAVLEGLRCGHMTDKCTAYNDASECVQLLNVANTGLGRTLQE